MPSFTFYNPVEGTSVNSGDFVGQPTLLIFFNSADDFDQSQMRMVSGIKEHYADKNVEVAVVCIDADEAGVLRLAVKFQPDFKILIAGKGASIESGDTVLPAFLLINADLGIVKKLEGKEEAKQSLFKAMDLLLTVNN